MQPYTEDFYKPYQEGKRRSAREIVPLVLELIQPKQVIDVGCGIGTWLSVFKECGVEDIQGLDGDWVDKRMLQIPEERFERNVFHCFAESKKGRSFWPVTVWVLNPSIFPAARSGCQQILGLRDLKKFRLRLPFTP